MNIPNTYVEKVPKLGPPLSRRISAIVFRSTSALDGPLISGVTISQPNNLYFDVHAIIAGTFTVTRAPDAYVALIGPTAIESLIAEP